jgi:hypothetical protein
MAEVDAVTSVALPGRLPVPSVINHIRPKSSDIENLLDKSDMRKGDLRRMSGISCRSDASMPE